MISAGFAPNESWDDALLSLRHLLTPWTWNKGKDLNKVKSRLKQYFPGSSVSLFLTARAGIYHILKNLGLNPKAQVLVQAFNCEAVILAILANDLEPVYVDIEATTYSMNINGLKAKHTPSAKVLILQHSFGIPPRHRSEILEFALKNKLTVIEDLALGFDPKLFKNDASSTIKLLSFGKPKVLSSLYGGAVLSDRPQLTKKLHEMEKGLARPSTWFIFNSLFYKPFSVFIKWTYDIFIGKILHASAKALGLLSPEVIERGFGNSLNKSFPNVYASLLLHQLNKFDQIMENRARISLKFNSTISVFNPDFSSPLTRFPLTVENRPDLLNRAAKQGIYLGLLFDQAIAPKDVDLTKMKYEKGSCPVAETVCEKIVNLPTLISEKEADRILNLLK